MNRNGNTRGFRRGFRGRRGGNNNARQGRPPKENESLYQPEQLKEIEVGITEYISQLDGCFGIIKQRYSDFQVNEIDLDGTMAKLTNTNVPEHFKKQTVEIPTDTPLAEHVSQEKWQAVLDMINSKDDSKVQIPVANLSKEQRQTIHKTFKLYFGNKIVSETKTSDQDSCIELKRPGVQGQDTRWTWPADVANYTHFILYKESIDTMNAIMSLSSQVRVPPSVFAYAGTKDKRAKTSQWISAKQVEPWKLLKRRIPKIRVGNFIFKSEPLKLGQLSGNYFRIALRNVTTEDEIIAKHVESLKENGFINYYGLQRFGNDKTVPTFEIGIKLLLGKWQDAINLILKPKVHDNPLAEICQAKKVYFETRDAKLAVKKLSQFDTLEAKLVKGLSEHASGDYVNALEKIPRNMRLLYIHSFQSYVWNLVVSKRIKEHGLNPIIGDLVLLEEEPETTSAEELVEIKDSEENVEGPQLAEIKLKQKVKVLEHESDLSNYTIYDVVLPTPGFDIIYPNNTVKDYYKEILNKHGMDLEMTAQKVKTYNLSGNYRKILSKPQDLTWKTVRYVMPNDDLISSDLDELLNHKVPEDNPEGKFKALILAFQLNSSNYATMVLREILKTDTSAQTQIGLNDSVRGEVQEVQEVKEENVVESEKSLLCDKDKFEAFKRSFLEDPEKSKAEENPPSPKKSKVESNGCPTNN